MLTIQSSQPFFRGRKPAETKETFVLELMKATQNRQPLVDRLIPIINEKFPDTVIAPGVSTAKGNCKECVFLCYPLPEKDTKTERAIRKLIRALQTPEDKKRKNLTLEGCLIEIHSQATYPSWFYEDDLADLRDKLKKLNRLA